jgi:hypothetical protein
MQTVECVERGTHSGENNICKLSVSQRSRQGLQSLCIVQAAQSGFERTRLIQDVAKVWPFDYG